MEFLPHQVDGFRQDGSSWAKYQRPGVIAQIVDFRERMERTNRVNLDDYAVDAFLRGVRLDSRGMRGLLATFPTREPRNRIALRAFIEGVVDFARMNPDLSVPQEHQDELAELSESLEREREEHEKTHVNFLRFLRDHQPAIEAATRPSSN